MHRLSLIGLLAVLATPLVAQDAPAPVRPSDQPVFRASADIITVDAVVTDRDGRHVTDLTRDDFEVTVAGKRQDLQHAIYIRTADQPRMLAAARAATPSADAAGGGMARSEASLALKTTGLRPERIARTIALVVDDLGLSFESTVSVRKALQKYIDTQMEPGDLVAIVRTAGGVGALQQFTTDKRLLHAAADRVTWDFRSRRGVAAFEAVTPSGLVGKVDDSAAGELRDLVTSVGSLGALDYIARGVANLPGRKCIVFFSEGFTSLFTDRAESGRIWRAMSHMLGRANAAGVVVYTIDARGLAAGGLTAEDNPQIQDSGGGRAGVPDDTANVRQRGADRIRSLLDSQESMQFIANQTGGLAVANTNDLNLGLARVLQDQQGYYLLGYAAPQSAPRSGWDQDRVKVRVTRPGLRVRARQGFFGPSDPNEPKAFSYDTLTTAALSPFAAGDLTVRLTSMFGYDVKDGAYVRSLLFMDTTDIRFDEDTPGRHTVTFEVNLLTVGDNGAVVAGLRRVVPLALDDDQFRLAQERGISFSFKTRIKEPGGYQMRAAALVASTTRVGSASQFVDVPKVGSGRLALSGVLLKGMADPAATRASGPGSEAPPAGLIEAVLLEPQVRVLQPGTDAVYAFEIYDGLKSEDAAALQMAAALLRDGRVVYQSPFSPVQTTVRQGKKVRAIPIAGTLALGKDMPAGPYTLEVIVRGRDAKRMERKQWLDFEIRR